MDMSTHFSKIPAALIFDKAQQIDTLYWHWFPPVRFLRSITKIDAIMDLLCEMDDTLLQESYQAKRIAYDGNGTGDEYPKLLLLSLRGYLGVLHLDYRPLLAGNPEADGLYLGCSDLTLSNLRHDYVHQLKIRASIAQIFNSIHEVLDELRRCGARIEAN